MQKVTAVNVVDAIISYRRVYHIGVGEFARVIGVSKGHWSAVEHGKRTISKDICQQVINCYKVDVGTENLIREYISECNRLNTTSLPYKLPLYRQVLKCISNMVVKFKSMVPRANI